MFDIITKPLGYILSVLSDLFSGNFAVSIFVFTILINVALIPLSIKSQKSSVQQARIKPKLDDLKKRYGDDKRKYNEAMQKLYQEENVSMAGGCLPMLLRLIIMLSIYSLIYSPLSYMSRVDNSTINNVSSTISTAISALDKDSAAQYNEKLNWATSRNQLQLVDIVRSDEKIAVLKELLGEKEYIDIKNIDKKFENVKKSLDSFKIDKEKDYNKYIKKLGWEDELFTKDLLQTALKDKDQTTIVKDFLKSAGYKEEDIKKDLEIIDANAKFNKLNKTLATIKKADAAKYDEYVTKLAWKEDADANKLFAAILKDTDKSAAFKNLLSEYGYGKIEKELSIIKEKDDVDYTFFTNKIDLTKSANFSFNIFKAWEAAWIMPIFAFLSQLLSSWVSMKIQKLTNPDAPGMSGMLLLMPVITLFIGFSLPGGVTFYWACSSLIGGAVQAGLQIFYGPQKMLAKERIKELAKQCKFEEGQIEKITADKAE